MRTNYNDPASFAWDHTNLTALLDTYETEAALTHTSTIQQQQTEKSQHKTYKIDMTLNGSDGGDGGSGSAVGYGGEENGRTFRSTRSNKTKIWKHKLECDRLQMLRNHVISSIDDFITKDTDTNTEYEFIIKISGKLIKK